MPVLVKELLKISTSRTKTKTAHGNKNAIQGRRRTPKLRPESKIQLAMSGC
jgi:hypothetical protein